MFSNLYMDWRKADGLCFFKFWAENLTEEENGDLIYGNLLYVPSVNDYFENEVLGAPLKKSRKDGNVEYVCKEGFIVELIASVFRNLSFDACNAVLMSKNMTLIRFLILGIRCRFRTVSILCLDAIARLAPTLTLSTVEASIDNGFLMVASLVKRLMNSDDRAEVLAGAEILAALCQNDSNFDEICMMVDATLCNRLFQYLMVPDIHLVVNCAEAIYQMSELGPTPCDVIASSEHNLNILLALTTVEAAAFGPDAVVNIKVVQQGGPMMPPQLIPNQSRMVMTRHQSATPQRITGPLQATSTLTFNSNQIIQTTFMFAASWLKGAFEPVPPHQAHCQQGETLIQSYNEYLQAATNTGTKHVFENPHHFAECISKVFPFCQIRLSAPNRFDTARIFNIKRSLRTSSLIGQASTPQTQHTQQQLHVQSTQQKQMSNLPLVPVVNGHSKDPAKKLENGVTADLHVVGTPVTAAELLDGERKQHELAIVKLENKPKTNGSSKVTTTNGHGGGDSLSTLLDDASDVATGKPENDKLGNGIIHNQNLNGISNGQINGHDETSMTSCKSVESESKPSMNSNGNENCNGNIEKIMPLLPSPKSRDVIMPPKQIFNFPCKWGTCEEGYNDSDSLHKHYVSVHLMALPSGPGCRTYCLWESCQSSEVLRLKWSMFSHVKDCHLNNNHISDPKVSVTSANTDIPDDAGLRAVLTNFVNTTSFHPVSDLLLNLQFLNF